MLDPESSEAAVIFMGDPNQVLLPSREWEMSQDPRLCPMASPACVGVDVEHRLMLVCSLATDLGQRKDPKKALADRQGN